VTTRSRSGALLVWHLGRKEAILANPGRTASMRTLQASRPGTVFTVPSWLSTRSRKTSKFSCPAPYRKPTQVDRASSPRGTSDSSLRNSAKKRPYLRYKAFPHRFCSSRFNKEKEVCAEQTLLSFLGRHKQKWWGTQRKSPWRLFTKNTAPCELARGCIGGDA